MVLFFCPAFPENFPAESTTESQVSPASPQACCSYPLPVGEGEALEVQKLGRIGEHSLQNTEEANPQIRASASTLAAATKTTTYNYGR